MAGNTGGLLSVWPGLWNAAVTGAVQGMMRRSHDVAGGGAAWRGHSPSVANRNDACLNRGVRRSQVFSNPKEVLEFIAAEGVQMVDLKTIDLPGRWHHVTVPASYVTVDSLRHGVGVDTSSYPGYKSVEAGDMRVVPDLSTGMVDPFCATNTLSFICSIMEPMSEEAYPRDPRGVARHAEQYFREVVSRGQPVFSPEMEFYVFSNVRYISEMKAAGYEVDAVEALWNSGDPYASGLGYAIPPHQGYHAAPPRDQLNDLRTEMLLAIEAAGVPAHYHHHEVGGAGPGGGGGGLRRADRDGRRGDEDEVPNRQHRPASGDVGDLHA